MGEGGHGEVRNIYKYVYIYIYKRNISVCARVFDAHGNKFYHVNMYIQIAQTARVLCHSVMCVRVIRMYKCVFCATIVNQEQSRRTIIIVIDNDVTYICNSGETLYISWRDSNGNRLVNDKGKKNNP